MLNDNPMKQPRNLLILLGFVCQGFAWGNYFMPAVFAGLWFVCLKFRRPRQYLPYHVELLFVALLLYLAYTYTGSAEFPKCLAIGNGLLAMQALRLTWPLDRRKKTLSVAIALTHLAIGSLVILDYSFLLVLACAVILTPRALCEIEQERFAQTLPPFKGLFDKRDWAIVTVIMVLFFLIFPRRQIVFMGTTGFNLARRGRLSDQLDTSEGGLEGGENVIFQIEGDEVGYLKCYALDAFDGDTWKTDRFSHALNRRFKRHDPDQHLYRKVTVENLKALGRALPTDGRVVSLRGNFFQDPYISRQDNVQVSFLWPKANNFYEYWTTFDGGGGSISKKERARYTSVPVRDERLIRFIDQIAGDATAPLDIAQRLEDYLRNNFTYKIGAPDLNRSAPVADFIFQAKEGHCERFASALACLLRLKNIPARVVIGFLPTEKNQIVDFYNVRSKDAHAWTEAWFEDRGWIILDATPAATEAASTTKNFTLSLIDWIEYVWYSKIVNYSFSDQNKLFSFSFRAIKPLIASLSRIIVLSLGCVIAVAAIAYAVRNRRLATFWKRLGRRRPSPTKARREASHFYGRMQKILSKRGYERAPAQTPLEFLEILRNENLPCFDAARFVTERFCDVKYGERPLTDKTREEIERNLRLMKRKVVRDQ